MMHFPYLVVAPWVTVGYVGSAMFIPDPNLAVGESPWHSLSTERESYFKLKKQNKHHYRDREMRGVKLSCETRAGVSQRQGFER